MEHFQQKFLSLEHNHYIVLNLETFSDLDLVKKHYKTLILKLHPDKNPDLDPQNFIDVQYSYKYLLRNKEIYDKILMMKIGDSLANIEDKVFLADNTEIENGIYDLGTGHGYLIKDIIEIRDKSKSKIVKIDNINEIHNTVAHNSKLIE